MKNRIMISSLIIGFFGATAGLVHAQYGGSRSESGSMQSDKAGSQRGGTVGQFIDDATVTTRVKSRFAQDDQVSAMNIGVETNGGVVQLSGYAGSEAEKTRAAEIASQVPDVKSVQNNIVVRGAGGTSGGSRSGGSSGY